MNVIEKARLIKELNELIHALDYRALSLFETAKYKQRLRDIFESCDEGYFKKQILQYRALTQPDRAAHQFAKTTVYYFSYRGFFYQDTDLEQVLYLLPESGWALLYGGKKGWQCWVIPAPNRTALISDWCKLEETYSWLEEQQNIYQCLVGDDELKNRAAILKVSQVTTPITELPPVAMETPETTSEEITANELIEPITEGLIAEDSLAASLSLEIPEKLKWFDHKLVWQKNDLIESDLQPYQFKEHIEWSEYCDCYAQLPLGKNNQNSEIYLAEQLTEKGGFYKYTLFLGLSIDNAIENIREYSQRSKLKIGAIKIANWHELLPALSDLSQVYSYYQSLEQPLWQAENYLPFIPNYFIHTQKFLHFDEAIANYTTPILLLKERNKIRIIHGQQRIRLSSHELAYPYLMLHREHGLSWQHIKQVISQLAHPVNVHELHQALLKSVS